MVWYVALIAILNLALGYALAIYLGAGHPPLAVTASQTFDDAEYSDDADAEYPQI
jgi:hypothetical protein